ncbi:PAS domain S-box-containing protein [Methylobacterium sp. BE186]|uniref:PAS domain-containing protein n=1 Tax=Methylobacterium sp. BE186 TaxID=2817715 RepID=UPI0028600B65|nr:PAS domain-containing protein [Methylobacterium sp. BE186]MDR7037622.1 PAS domain S-box-containing protein [Methylobacterium sp. BE186]
MPNTGSSHGDNYKFCSSLFRTALDSIGEAVVITTAALEPPGPVIAYVNPAFTRLTGYPEQEVAGRSPRILQGPLTDRAALDRLRAELARREAFEGTTTNYRRDGTPYILHWHITPLRDEAGALTHWISLQREVGPEGYVEPDPHRRLHDLEAQAEAALARRAEAEGTEAARALAVREVRATLGLVRSIVRRTADTAEAADELVLHLDDRLRAAGRLKVAALQSRPGLGLAHIVGEELSAFEASERGRVRIAGPEVTLRGRAAELLGLAIHELTANAVSFGALAEAAGTISVRWRVERRSGAPRLILRWVEAGAGQPVRPPARAGFGTTLLERVLPDEIGARTALAFAPGGFACRLEVPLPEDPGRIA